MILSSLYDDIFILMLCFFLSDVRWIYACFFLKQFLRKTSSEYRWTMKTKHKFISFFLRFLFLGWLILPLYWTTCPLMALLQVLTDPNQVITCNLCYPHHAACLIQIAGGQSYDCSFRLVHTALYVLQSLFRKWNFNKFYLKSLMVKCS